MQQYPMTQRGNNNNNKTMIIILVALCVLAVIALVGLVWVIARNGDDGADTDVISNVEYVVVYDLEGKEVEVPKNRLQAYLDEGYTMEKPDKKPDVSLDRYGDAVVLYNPNGGTIEVSPEDVEQYLDREGDDKYYTEPVMYIYHVTEERKVVKTSESEEYLKATKLNDDGTEEEIDSLERWYAQPVVVMYAPANRYVVINSAQEYVEQYIEAGWHTEPVAAVKRGTEEKIVKLEELDKYLADGWKEFNPKAKPCDICQSTDHVTEEHPFCQYCNSGAHLTENHPVCRFCYSKAHTSNQHVCSRCGKRGHNEGSCNLETCDICGQTGHSRAGHTCTKCGGKGHDASACTVKCDICGQTGHSRAGHTCTKCGGKGHDASACTACNYCGSTSHTTQGHPICQHCGSGDHTSTCQYCCTQSHESWAHPTCSWCGQKTHTSDGHDEYVATH